MARITQPGLNGVDLAAVGDVTERYLADPDSGRRGFSARVRWLGGYRTESALAEGALVPIPNTLARPVPVAARLA